MTKTSFYTSRLHIRPITVLDADDMYEYAKTPYVGPTAGWKPHESRTDTISVINGAISNAVYYRNSFASFFVGTWAIVLQDTGKMIGTVDLYDFIPHHKAVMGYSLNPQYWGLGIAPEAAREIVHYAFDFLKIKRLEASVIVDNNQSIRVCEKLGFTREGIRRKGHQRYDGTFLDTIVYSLTDDDYRELYGEEINENR